MMTLFYILDLRWVSFDVDCEFDELPKITRKYIYDLVENLDGVNSPKWEYVVELIREMPIRKIFDDGRK